jgi:hypothetical protein
MDLEIAELLERWGPAAHQRVPWVPERWLAHPKLADLPVLDRLASVTGGRGIARSDVLVVAEDHAVDLLVASMVWGFGSIGYGPARTAEMLREGAHKHAPAIVDEVRRLGASAFPSLFKPNGRGQIRGLGVAMGTKLLHFAGKGDVKEKPLPLVYDIWVYEGLRRLPRSEQPTHSDSTRAMPHPRGWVATAAYVAYCRWAADIASRHSCAPEDVEWALFAQANPDLSPP